MELGEGSSSRGSPGRHTRLVVWGCGQLAQFWMGGLAQIQNGPEAHAYTINKTGDMVMVCVMMIYKGGGL